MGSEAAADRHRPLRIGRAGGQECGLEGPRRGHHQNVPLERNAQLVPVVGTAEENRVLARVQEPVVQQQGRIRPERCSAAKRLQRIPTSWPGGRTQIKLLP